MHLSCCTDHVVPWTTQKNLVRVCASFASCISSRWASRLANRWFQTLELWIDKGPSFLWTLVLSWIILLDYATSPGWTLAFCGHLHGCHQSSDGGALLGLFRGSGWGNCVRVNKRWTTPSTTKGKTQQHPHVFWAEEGVEDNLANLLILSKQSKKHVKRWIFGEIVLFQDWIKSQWPERWVLNDLQVTLSWSFLGSAFSTLSGIWLLNQWFSPGSKESEISGSGRDSLGRSTNLQWLMTDIEDMREFSACFRLKFSMACVFARLRLTGTNARASGWMRSARYALPLCQKKSAFPRANLNTRPFKKSVPNLYDFSLRAGMKLLDLRCLSYTD